MRLGTDTQVLPKTAEINGMTEIRNLLAGTREADADVKCRRCGQDPAFITPSGYLCSQDALDDMRTDPDWVPLIRTDLLQSA